MIVKDLLNALTKYYQVTIVDDSNQRMHIYEDQTVVDASLQTRTIISMDFYEDSGEGEGLLIYLGEEK